MEIARIVDPGVGILEEISRLLKDAGLPDCDLASTELYAHFGSPKRILGVGGLQVFGGNNLLRSIAVAPSHRGMGIGSAIVEHILASLGQSPQEVFLFTSTAVDFFRRFGFMAIPWSMVPEALRVTPLVSGHCRESAVPMLLELSE